MQSFDSLSAAVQSWMRRMGASQDLADLAAWVSHGDSQSHAGVTLDVIRQWSGKSFATPVLDSPLVLTADQASSDADLRQPLVVDAAGRVFLLRNFKAEVAVARAIIARMQDVLRDSTVAEDTITTLFGPATGGDDALQRQAVRKAAGRRIFVLAGGPGTGKTTTVFRMLMAAGYNAQQVALSAPTGKAAQRLTEALRSEATRAGGSSNGLEQLRASTIHRWLIEMRSGQVRSPRVLVIDEASMMDLPLLQQVLEALDPTVQLILVGDPNQLMSVGTGTVLGDLVSALSGTDFMVELTHNFRVASSPNLVAINNAALIGDAKRFESLLGGLTDAGTRDARRRLLDPWASPLSAGIHAVLSETSAVRRAATYLAMARDRQMLASLRNGPLGATALSAEIESRIVATLPDDAIDTPWFEGRRILVTENHYPLGLFNGDIGVCTLDPDSGMPLVWFESTADDGTVELRSVPANALPAHESAWAMTIHKSQGSEFAHLAIVLPGDTGSRILSRQLIYTAVSRTKAGGTVDAVSDVLQVWGHSDVLAAGLNTVATRYGGLQDLLRTGIATTANSI